MITFQNAFCSYIARGVGGKNVLKMVPTWENVLRGKNKLILYVCWFGQWFSGISTSPNQDDQTAHLLIWSVVCDLDRATISGSTFSHVLQIYFWMALWPAHSRMALHRANSGGYCEIERMCRLTVVIAWRFRAQCMCVVCWTICLLPIDVDIKILISRVNGL